MKISHILLNSGPDRIDVTILLVRFIHVFRFYLEHIKGSIVVTARNCLPLCSLIF